jgi:hypothetical protein
LEAVVMAVPNAEKTLTRIRETLRSSAKARSQKRARSAN